LLVYTLTIEEIRAGGRVLLIDFETGPWDARDRLRDLGATDSELGQLLYLEPSTPATPETIAALADLEPSLVIVDAAAGAYANLGLDDNRRDDVESFAAVYVREFWLRGIATMLVDHVVKNGEKGGRYAIGSERKLGAADVHLRVETIVPLHRGGRGLYRVLVKKDRLGHLTRPVAGELEFVSNPDTHRITWTLTPAAEHSDGAGEPFQPTFLMERVSKFIAEHDEPVSRNRIEKSGLGKQASYVRDAIDDLATGGYIAEGRGARGARVYTHVRPFTTSSDTPEKDLVRPRLTSSDEVASTSSDLVSPYKGDEVTDEDDELERLAALGDALGLR